MNISITEIDPGSLKKRLLLLWAIKTRRVANYIAFAFVFGLVIFICTFTSSYSVRSEQHNNVTYVDFHLGFAVGLCFMLLAAIYFIQLRKSRNQFIQAGDGYIFRAMRAGDISRALVLNSEGVQYSNFEQTLEMKWSAFTSYKIYKGHIFLFHSLSDPSNIIVELAMLTVDEQGILLSFLAGPK